MTALRLPARRVESNLLRYSDFWRRPMPVDPELLAILACPECKTPVTPIKDGAALKCERCKRVYPVKDDIPVMLLDEATIEP
jgi:uncharacterized protein YbaR (Trm112 family)